jgi:hypothetical protein
MDRLEDQMEAPMLCLGAEGIGVPFYRFLSALLARTLSVLESSRRIFADIATAG